MRKLERELKEYGPVIKTKSGNGIRSIVPHELRIDNVEDRVELFMRVSDVYKNKKLLVKVDGVEIKKIKKLSMTPGEMERIHVDYKMLDGKEASVLSVEVVEAGA